MIPHFGVGPFHRSRKVIGELSRYDIMLSTFALKFTAVTSKIKHQNLEKLLKQKRCARMR